MEFVLVVRRAELFPTHYPQGLLLGDEALTYLERARSRSFFIERRFAEKDPTLKQIIPYCLVARPGRNELFLLKRLPTQGEARLHGKLSIGVGGHINPIDLDEGADLLQAGLRRELEEEVALQGEERLEFLGVLNDDGNPVGAVHFGLVHALVLAPGGTASVRERDAMEGEFLPLEALQGLCHNAASFESWSEAVLRRSSGWYDRLF